VPNLGVVRRPSGDGSVFADIPGLIAGAHTGLGLGHDFLRHIERTRLLLHLVDATAEHPLDSYQIIQQELTAYGRHLVTRPQILALSKVDSLSQAELKDRLAQFEALGIGPIHCISAVTGVGLTALLQEVWLTLDNLPLEVTWEVFN
jgi:GTP-binding protein